MANSNDVAPAIALAQALDREDYQVARQLMSDTCVYEFRGDIIDGAEAIIASYRGNGDHARERFDSIEYESSVITLSAGRARIDYTDIVTNAGETLVHRCAQEVDFESSGLITRIRHLDLPGQRQALAKFVERHG